MKLLDSGRQNKIIVGWSQEKGGEAGRRRREKKPVKEEDLNRQMFS
jgi:hypothetical protein